MFIPFGLFARMLADGGASEEEIRRERLQIGPRDLQTLLAYARRLLRSGLSRLSPPALHQEFFDNNCVRIGEVLDKRLAVRIKFTLAHQVHLKNPLADGVHQREQMRPAVLVWSRKFRPQPRLDVVRARVA